MIRAVIFDFDGVIANSEPLHFTAFHDVLAAEGVAFSEEEYYTRYLGYDDAGVFRAVKRDRRLTWTVDRVAKLIARKAARLERIEQERPILFPGAEQAIRRLAALVPLAIASGALRAEILRVLDRAALTPYFGAVVAAEDSPASKPAPEPYLRAVSLLSTSMGEPLQPDECGAVEDSRWGLQSARAAGLHTVAVTNTYAAASLSEAEIIIANLDALDLPLLRQF